MTLLFLQCSRRQIYITKRGYKKGCGPNNKVELNKTFYQFCVVQFDASPVLPLSHVRVFLNTSWLLL